jgi:hypothetical protein
MPGMGLHGLRRNSGGPRASALQCGRGCGCCMVGASGDLAADVFVRVCMWAVAAGCAGAQFARPGLQAHQPRHRHGCAGTGFKRLAGAARAMCLQGRVGPCRSGQSHSSATSRLPPIATSSGSSVLEMVRAFEGASGKKVRWPG